MRKPAQRPNRPRAGDTSKFVKFAPVVMQALIDRYGVLAFQAAGVLGNLGRESGGLLKLRQIGFEGRSGGGYGWAQWSGARASAFHVWCAEHHLDWRSDAGNLGFLVHELDGEYREAVEAIRASKSLRGATVAFERCFERAGVPAMNERVRWAHLALDAYRAVRSGETVV